jgi:predicted dehydrogenase
LSTAGIGKKNWKAIFNSGNCIVTAVASRDLEKSLNFIDDCSREAAFETKPTALGSYEELLASKNVDAVYVPLPTALRKDWVVRAANSGKHIVCEKPCAVDSASLDEMLSACKKNNVQFMDGVMFMHSQRLARVRETLDDGASVGQIKRIVAQFSFPGHEEFFRKNIRVNAALEPAGCLGDLGWYDIRFALWAMNWQCRAKFPPARSRKPIRPCRRNFPPNCFSTTAFPRTFIVRSSISASNGSTSAARKAIFRFLIL